MSRKSNKQSTTITFRTDVEMKRSLDQKAQELGTTSTELIKDGIERMLSEESTLKGRVRIMVENQNRFNQLFQKIEEGNITEIKKVALEILKGEQEAWQL